MTCSPVLTRAEEVRGDCSRKSWRQIYWKYIYLECTRIGREPNLKVPMIMERFAVVDVHLWQSKINPHSMESDRVSTIIDFADLQRYRHFPFGVVLLNNLIPRATAKVNLPSVYRQLVENRSERRVGCRQTY
jgi:hypothetical protein